MTYSATLLHYFDCTEHAGCIEPSNCVVTQRYGVVDNREIIELSIQWQAARITRARFRAYGSPALIAAAEWACAWLEGKNYREASGLSNDIILENLQLEQTSIHIAQMVLVIVNNCLLKSVDLGICDDERVVP